MGEVTEMILEGILCELCGVYIDDDPPGVPRKCKNCAEGIPDPTTKQKGAKQQ